MAPRRKVIPVTLTATQREKLERLWFFYGNHGPHTTPGNHAFIQGMLEHGIDIRPLKHKGYMPSEECERAVDAALSKSRETSENNSDSPKRHNLTLVPTSIQQSAIKPPQEKENELKELIRSLRGRNGPAKPKANDDGEMPPAA
jgi:hypothetical protein